MAPWTGEYGGRRTEVDVDENAERVRLRVDGEEIAVVEDVGRFRFGAGGVLVEVDVKLSGQIKRAGLVAEDDVLPLDPPADTKEGQRELRRRARAAAWRRSRLRAWGQRARERERELRASPWRHVVRGVGRVVVPLLGLGALLALLPTVELPAVHIPFPDVHLPDVPSIPLPGWARWLADRSQYFVPIVVGLVLSLRELHRRRPGSRVNGSAEPF